MWSKNFKKIILCNFLVQTLQCFRKDFQFFFFTTKSWKNYSQKLLRIPQIHFFSLLPWLPKRPKQKNSCSKMWPIDQLYIELESQLVIFKDWKFKTKLLIFNEQRHNFQIFMQLSPQWNRTVGNCQYLFNSKVHIMCYVWIFVCY